MQGNFRQRLKGILVSCFIAVISFSSVHAQEDYARMMADPNVNFYEVKEAFERAWENRPYEKGKGWMAFRRWEWFMEPRVWPTGDRFPMNAVKMAMEESPEMFSFNENMPGSWTYIGNTAIPANGGGVGRVNSVRNQPGSSSILYACAPAGGLWKTTNGGTNWALMNTDFLAAIGVSDVAIDHTNPNVIYIATGDGDAGDTYSLGVLKSTDGGATWNTTGLNWTVQSNLTTSRILMHPSNNNILIVATNSGIYRTLDGGVNWTQEASGSFKDLKFKPGDPNTVYATGSSFWRSTNNGDTWTQITSGLPTSGVSRMAIAVSAANSAYVYVLAGNNSDQGLLGVYRSTDSGLNFSTRATTPNLLGWDASGSDGGGQAWYDLQIEADPANAEVIYTGGVNIWKSSDGGSTWLCNGHWYGQNGLPYVHADIHGLYFIPGTSTLLVGCDGGVFTTSNGGSSYTDISSNLQIAQQYRLGVAATNGNRVITGWQDNGTNLKDGATHQRVIGGDGMECAIDPTNQNIMYGELYYGRIFKSTTGAGGFFQIVGSGGAAGTVNENGGWVTPYVLGSNPNHIYVGKSRVYLSTDGGTNWSALGAIAGGGNIYGLAVAPSNNNVIYASKGGTLFKSTDGTNFNALSGLPGNTITYIAVHNTDPNKLWVTFSGFTSGVKVYESVDGGANWTNISGTLPNIPANTIVFQNGTADGLYVGTDAGVYYRDDALGAWIPYMNGLPNVVVDELQIHYGTNVIVAATYGRGTWQAPLYALPQLDLAVAGINAPAGSSCDPNFVPSITVVNTGEDPITSFTLQYNTVGQAVQTYNWTGTLTTGQSVTPVLPGLNYGTGTFTFTATLTMINGQGTDDEPANNTTSSPYSIITAPANDVCANAIPIVVNGPAANADNSSTCSDGPAPSCGGGTIRDVWYSFVYTSGNITIQTTLGSNSDTRLAVFNGCGGAEIGCNDDASGIGLASRITLACASLTSGQTYYIQASGYESTVGTFTVSVTSSGDGCTDPLACNYDPCAVNNNGTCTYSTANDVCSGAIALTAGTPVTVNNTVTCSNGPNPSCGGSSLIRDMWYSFTYTGGTVSISTSGGTLTDPRLAVYTACGGTQIACDDDDGAGNYPLINFGCTPGNGVNGANEATVLTPGSTYLIQAGGFSTSTGTFNLVVNVTNVNGCTNPVACNYNPCANVNDGSCTLPVIYYQDLDGDTYGNPSVTQSSCTPVAGYVLNNQDCNDNNAAIRPGAIETCNGVDDDCDGLTDEGVLLTFYRDLDNDGFGNIAVTTQACSAPAGYVSNSTDCNDNNNSIYPGAPELCNNVDDDCDGQTDEGVATQNWYADNDGDTFGAGAPVVSCSQPVGYVNNNLDCNDNNSAIRPTATEVCNGVDDDCDGLTDEGVLLTFYRDLDNDGFGNIAVTTQACSAPVGYVSNNTDCNDNNNSIYPGAPELCNNVDDDCDGQTDEGVTTQNWYADNDGDTFGAGAPVVSCSQPVGYVNNNLDCNDNNSAIRPTATEVCNGVDDDCDGLTDEGVLLTFYRDFDNDGFGDLAVTTQACSAPAGYVANSTDCNDSNSSVYPGAAEICNGIDDDCDGSTDENGCGGTDADGDGFTVGQGDCNDNNSDVYPGADEWCNNIDDDCDGQIDEGLAYSTYYADSDGDSYGNPLVSQVACIQPSGYVTNALDCNDSNSAVRPGATELCNGYDDDCDGIIDEGCGPINDEMLTALPITVGNYGSCSSVNGTLIGATPSGGGGAPCITCNDVWYYFEADVPGIRLQCSTSSNNVVLELCDDNGIPVEWENMQSAPGTEILNFGGLTEGDTYFVRVINYNNAQGSGNFQLCASQLPDTRCNYGPGPYNLCALFKAEHVGASSYTFHFTSNTTNQTYSRTVTGGSTMVQISSVPGILWNDSYTVAIESGFNVTNGLGQTETVIVDNNEPCTVIVNPHPFVFLRASDACPNVKSINSIIGANAWICAADRYEWEFTRTDLPAQAPFTVMGPQTNRFLQLSSSIGIVNGATYSVRIRPHFLGGVIGNWGNAGCLQVGAPAGMPMEDPGSFGLTGELVQNKVLVVFPNPNSGDVFYLNAPEASQGQVIIRDLSGRELVKAGSFDFQNGTIEVRLQESLKSGLYLIELIAGEEHYMTRIVVQK